MGAEVDVEIEAGRLVRVGIRNGWRDRTDARGLSEELTAAIRAALPEDETAPPPAEGDDATRRQVSPQRLREYMAMHREWMQRSRDYLRRSRAGEFTAAGADEVVDDQRHVAIFLDGGRFDSVALDPEWAGRATLQSLADTLLSAFAGVDLLGRDPGREEREALRRLDRQIREFVS
ncbi:hypothetical protein [Tessaracoccus palaemonis]|uniref:Uncharacterized protein n=1 Tax=Tessaracoccus palaemonis TaxID=2829499 RepID=A0ABX8SIZ4_9ACTN|nr:hypothetical protein [Tessaracoccus palaemonis]QXT63278.1 hypothetical protein KDB89_01975 [Tessaracoccus palaemonis]